MTNVRKSCKHPNSLFVRYIVAQSGQKQDINGHAQKHSGGFNGHGGQTQSTGVGVSPSGSGNNAKAFAGAACAVGATAAGSDAIAIGSIDETLHGRQLQIGFGHAGQRQTTSFIDMGHLQLHAYDTQIRAAKISKIFMVIRWFISSF